ncbi:PLP-dependent aminotransferase family protein [Salinicola endophyticus]|uniref:PLP-dependent aminotransferase family protein n=1 Tax=Salinicola endophyticus TaxID=1949083 RepID=A0ABY8FGF9_9GAMM|nr:PLP-dependent aminotransferase family protein [Salinicola endophyticus]WFF41145.1 PLP-dependent aminotransferase family protein [Salinicola endophyticus]
MHRYERLADHLRERIQAGFYQVHERLPSVRALAQAHGVSLSTVQHAYHQLEDAQLIEARPKSGYFVSPRRERLPAPPVARTAQRPVEVSQWEHVREGTCVLPDTSMHNLGRGMPDIDAPTLKPLLRALARVSRRQDLIGLNYDTLHGRPELREQIARLAVGQGCRLHPDDIVVTTGCHEAISIAMRAVCEPGGIIAVDSPSFYGALQSIRAYGMKAMEIPTDPETGISLEALELALEQWPIRAIQLTPTCNNPLGYTLSEARKRALYALAQRFDVAIIEDDVYGDLSYGFPRPVTIKSFDEDGRVLLCSSFSKTLAPGLRIGWIAPGRYHERALHMKYVGTGSTATQGQMAVAEFIREGHHEPHLRRMRAQYQGNRDRMLDVIESAFPASTRVSYPAGGFMLWLECADGIDSVALNQRLMAEGIRIAPGVVFSATGKYRHCLRLNHAVFDAEIARAVSRVGHCVAEMLTQRADAGQPETA